MTTTDDPRCCCRTHGRRVCPMHQPIYDPDADTIELDPKELLPVDDSEEPTLPGETT